MLLKQEIKLRDALVSFTNKLEMFKITQKDLTIINSSKTSMILKKKVKYKLLQLLRVAIVTTINSDKKTNNNSTFNDAFVKLFIFIKRLKTKEIEEIKDCKCYFINVDLLKQINYKLKNKIEMRIKSKYFFYNLFNYKINVNEELFKLVLCLYLQNR